MKIRNILTLAALSLLAVSCIGVENVEETWNKSKGDADLVGLWEGNNDSKCSFIKTDQDYLITTGTNGLEGGCKSFDVNGHKYVIVASLKASLLGFGDMEADSKNGTLLRYEVKGDTLKMYSYNGDKLKEAIKAGKVKGEVDENDSAKLKVLDADTIKWLGEAAEGLGWDEQVYKRVKK